MHELILTPPNLNCWQLLKRKKTHRFTILNQFLIMIILRVIKISRQMQASIESSYAVRFTEYLHLHFNLNNRLTDHDHNLNDRWIKSTLNCIVPSVVDRILWWGGGECGGRSDCTCVQSDLAVHSPQNKFIVANGIIRVTRLNWMNLGGWQP